MPSTNEEREHNRRFWVNTLLSPGTAALIDRMSFHPLDTIASFQQKDNLGFRQASSYIYKRLGYRGFYQGLSMPLILSAIPGHIVFFGTYNAVKETLHHNNYRRYYAPELIGSAVTSLLGTALSTPIEAKRLRDTFNIKTHASNTSWRLHFKGFFSLSLKMGTQLPIALAGTDILKDRLCEYGKRTDNQALKPWLNSKNPSLAFFTGVLMGMVSQAVTNPLDVIKTRVMSDYSANPGSFWHHAKQAHRERALFTSTFTRLGRWGISVGLVFAVMTKLNNLLLEDPRSTKLRSPKADSASTTKLDGSQAGSATATRLDSPGANNTAPIELELPQAESTTPTLGK